MQQTHLYKGGSGLTEKDTPPCCYPPTVLSFLSVHLSFGSSESLPLASNSTRTLINLLFHRLVLASSVIFIFLCPVFDTLCCPAFSQLNLKWSRQLTPKILFCKLLFRFKPNHLGQCCFKSSGWSCPEEHVRSKDHLWVHDNIYISNYMLIKLDKKKSKRADDIGGLVCIIITGLWLIISIPQERNVQ